MRKLEKYFLMPLTFVTLLVLSGVVDSLVLVALLWLLGLIYIVGGYWLFQSPSHPKIIPVLSGVALGVGLLIVPMGIGAGMGWIKVLMFSIPNVILSLKSWKRHCLIIER